MIPEAHDMSLLGLILQADAVVKSVMAILVLASVATWAIILEKMVVLVRLGRSLRELSRLPRQDPAGGEGQGETLPARVLRAGFREWRDGRDPVESRGEFRARLEHAMRSVLGRELRRAEPGLPWLATIAAVAPFIGLFGTVWGIMNSFSAIARNADTSLAVVAPGIAEALFATAIGLVAAIPAVIGYNRLGVRLGRLRAEGNEAIGELAGSMARQAPASRQPGAARA